MPPETFVGASIASVLEQARETLGPDAMILEVRKIATPAGPRFELLAGDGTTVSTGARDAMPPAEATVRAIRGLQGSKGPRPEGLTSRIALVGPTGAGKTTTLAKLANHPRAFGGRTVGLVCLDTIRVGAVEQSRLYAKLSNLPVEVIYEAREIPRALSRLRRREVLLIDTAGRGPLARGDREATLELLRLLSPTEVHLVLPAGIRSRHARRIVEEYRPYGVTHLLPTKVDEYPDDDWIFHLSARVSLPIRWVACGHGVPHDLHDASDGDRRGRGGIASDALFQAGRGTA